jgi:four helix bundle protein
MTASPHHRMTKNKKMTHKNLQLYQLSLDLVVNVYKLTESFPRNEEFGLISQIRRASVSIPSNISEGASRGSTKDFIRFLNMTSGSLSEVETQLEIAERLKYIEIQDDLKNQILTIRKMLYRLKESLKKKV